MRNLIGNLWNEWKTVEGQIDELTDRLEQIAVSDAGCCRIRNIPGIGPVVATAIVAAIGNGAASARDGTLLRGWALCHGSTRPAARPSCWILVSAATSITQDSDPRCSCSGDAHQARPPPDWRMDERSRSQSSARRTGCGYGQQARTDRIDRALHRRRLPAYVVSATAA